MGTEFGVFATVDGGQAWFQLKNGMPPISVRELVIQGRENDLVAGTFGRGIFILDDYTPLRLIKPETLAKEMHLFPVKDAPIYIQTSGKYGQGATAFAAPNPEYGAVFNYYLKEPYLTKKEIRQKAEKDLFAKGAKIQVATWEQEKVENMEIKPYLLFTVADEAGRAVREIRSAPAKGVNRVVWDLKYAPFTPVPAAGKFDPFRKDDPGFMVMPGRYKVSVAKVVDDVITPLGESQEFAVKILFNATLAAPNRAELVDFQNKVAEMTRIAQGTLEEERCRGGQGRPDPANRRRPPGGPRRAPAQGGEDRESPGRDPFRFQGIRGQGQFRGDPGGPHASPEQDLRAHRDPGFDDVQAREGPDRQLRDYHGRAQAPRGEASNDQVGRSAGPGKGIGPAPGAVDARPDPGRALIAMAGLNRREFLAACGAAAVAVPVLGQTAPKAPIAPPRIWIDPRFEKLAARPRRKIHLDFHNTRFIPKVGERFDEDEFGDRLLSGNVDAVVVFAKDMHGYFYYPSRFGPVHPGLSRDLLGAQVRACRKRKIAVYAYYCTTWDNNLAENHHEWLVIRRDGSNTLPKPDETARWTALCLSHEPFVNLMIDHTREFVAEYELDGAWFDMPVPRGGECFCPECLKQLKARRKRPS